MEAREAIRRIRRNSHPLEPRGSAVAPQLGTLPGLRAILFDVYGTLFVSASGDLGAAAPAERGAESGVEPRGALQRALRACGLQLTPAAAGRAVELLLGEIRASHERSRRRGIRYPEVDIRRVFHRVLRRLDREGALVLPADPAGRAAPQRELCECLALEYECRVNPTWPMPGLLELLTGLRDRGWVMGLVSNAQFYTPWLFPAHLGLRLRQLGIRPGLCAWSYRLGEAKPAPTPFSRVLARLAAEGIDANAVLYVGNDRRNDVAPARGLGCRTALFAGDLRSYRPRDNDPGLASVRPDRLITALSQLPALLSP
jgi:putative hydrolase of the HAD superfamily